MHSSIPFHFIHFIHFIHLVHLVYFVHFVHFVHFIHFIYFISFHFIYFISFHFIHSFIQCIAWAISTYLVSVVVNRWFGTGPPIHSSLCHLECEQDHQIWHIPKTSQHVPRHHEKSFSFRWNGCHALKPPRRHTCTPAVTVLVPSCSILFPWKSSTHSTLQKLAKTWQPATRSFKAKFRSSTAFDQLDSLSFTCSTASALHPFVITAASQSKHGQMGPPFSILFPHVMRRYRVWRRFPRVSFTAPQICECCSTAETVQPCTKGGHWKPPTLTACHWGGRCHSSCLEETQSRSIKQGNSENNFSRTWQSWTWSMSMVRYRVLRGAAGCQRSILNCRSPETSGWLQDAASMLSRLSLSLSCSPLWEEFQTKSAYCSAASCSSIHDKKNGAVLGSNPDLALAHLQPSLLPNNFVWTWSSKNVGYGF